MKLLSSSLPAGLRPFIPPVLYQWPGFTEQHEHRVAAMFIDVAGFTSLSETLMALGPEGAEVLDRAIAGYFDALLDVVEAYGGTPIKISGDALTVIFWNRDDALADTGGRALACAWSLRRARDEVARVRTPSGQLTLAHKIGLGAGRLVSGAVGDPKDRSEFVFAGEALERAVAAEHRARAGEVWVDPVLAMTMGGGAWWAFVDPEGFCRVDAQAAAALVERLGGAEQGPRPARRGSNDRAPTVDRASTDRAPTAEGRPIDLGQVSEARSIDLGQMSEARSIDPGQMSEGRSIDRSQMSEGRSIDRSQTAESSSIDGDAAPSSVEGLDLERYLSLIPSAVRAYAEQGTLNYLCRHQNLTVLFAGCPGMRLDSAGSLEQLDAHYRRMQRVIERHGGFLSEFEGADKGAKLIVLFGAPAMLEDPVGRAVRCAQEMQREARAQGVVSDQRIGLTSGPLYVGRIGCRSLVKYSALGDRMNVAARLMTTASPWSILAEHSTAERCPDVPWGVPRRIRLKGKDELIRVHPLEAAGAVRNTRRGRGIIGRTTERRQLQARLGALLDGQGALVALQGGPGTGKTRLLGFVQRTARELRLPCIFWNGATSGFRGGPIAALRPLLLHLAGLDPKVSSRALLEGFEVMRGRLPETLRGPVAELAPLLGLSVARDPILAQLPPDRLQRVQLGALVDLLDRLFISPLVFILDAGERLDDGSVAALAELAPQLARIPLLVVVAHRVEEGERNPVDRLVGAPGVEALQVRVLSRRQMARLAARRLKVERVDREIESLLAERAHGIALHVETWIDHLKANGHIRIVDQVAYLTTPRSGEGLPDRLEALILTKLERLSSEAQLTVRVASVVGPSFLPGEVVALHPEELPAEAVGRHLQQAAAAGILWHDRESPPRLLFSRPEVLQAIHGSMPFTLRRTLHGRRVQQILAGLEGAPDGDLILQLARHYEYVDAPEAQRRTFVQAAVVCRERKDPRGMVYWSRRTIELCEKLHDRTGYVQVADHLQLGLQLLGDNEERLTVVRLWAAEALRADDPRSLMLALQASARVRQRMGDGVGACADLDRALMVARGLNDRDLLIDALSTANAVHGEGGRNQQALDAAEEALRSVSEADSNRLFTIHFSRGFALNQMGRSTEAYEAFQQAMKCSSDSGEVWQQAMLLGNIGVALWAMGHPEEGHATLLKALALKRKVGDQKEIGMGLLNVGFSFHRLGELSKGRAYTEDARREFARRGFYRGELVALGNLGEVAWLTGAWNQASQYYAQAEALLEKYPHASLRIELNLRQGELALSQGQFRHAQYYFRSALEASGDRVETGFACNALEGLAESYRGLGDLEQARSYIDQALAKLKVDALAVASPHRVWWRAAVIAREIGELERATACADCAVQLLERECSRLRSTASRSRMVRAFPWNVEIAKHQRAARAAQPAADPA